jgi:hypothetical protein
MWMGPAAFAFYLQAAVYYLQSEKSAGDAHFVDCLYEIVVFRFKEKEFSLAIDIVNRMIDCVIDDYEKFKVNRDVYGDLLEKYKRLRTQLADGSVAKV